MSAPAFMSALKPKAKAMAPKGVTVEVEAEPEGKGDDYRAIMKEAAKDGDWDGFVEAICSYVDSKE